MNWLPLAGVTTAWVLGWLVYAAGRAIVRRLVAEWQRRSYATAKAAWLRASGLS